MSRFKLICEDEAIPFGGASKIIQEFDTDDLVFILGNMTTFLQKSGYIDNSKYMTLERTVNLDISEDLDEFTENLFASNGGTMNDTPETTKISTITIKV
jgi:hypothetical protein